MEGWNSSTSGWMRASEPMKLAWRTGRRAAVTTICKSGGDTESIQIQRLQTGLRLAVNWCWESRANKQDGLKDVKGYPVLSFVGVLWLAERTSVTDRHFSTSKMPDGVRGRCRLWAGPKGGQTWQRYARFVKTVRLPANGNSAGNPWWSVVTTRSVHTSRTNPRPAATPSFCGKPSITSLRTWAPRTAHGWTGDACSPHGSTITPTC